MSSSPRKLLYDGWLQLKSCNGIESPVNLDRSQVHRAVNCSFRNGEVGPRPGFRFRQLNFDDDVDKNIFDSGRWHGAMTYRPDRGNSFHLVSKGGYLWKVEPYNNYSVKNVSVRTGHSSINAFIAPVIGGSVTIAADSVADMREGAIIQFQSGKYQVNTYDVSLNEITCINLSDPEGTSHPANQSFIAFDTNNSKSFKHWMIQAESWALIQDGTNRCIIFDGTTSRRATSLEVPIGTSMAYGLGRLWLSNPNQDGFAASDLIYGPSGSSKYRYRDSVLKFTENTFLSGGGWFSVPLDAGKIRGMRFIANLDVVLGQGPLQVFTENGSFSVKVPANRAQWDLFGYDQSGTLAETAIDPIQTVSLIEQGAASDLGIVAINSDFFFRSRDGIRTFQLSRRQFGTWANTPIGQNVDWVLDLDQKSLLQYSSATVFEKRYMCLCAPQVEDRGVVHKGLVSLDFQQNRWEDNSPPDWDGLWTVSYFYQIFSDNYSGEDRCFAYSRNVDGEVELFEMDVSAHYDQANATQPTLIRWSFETGTAFFPTEGSRGIFDLKRLYGADIRVAELEQNVEFNLRWKPDLHPCWFKWAFWTECAPLGADCGFVDVSECRDWSMAKPQIRPQMGIPQPPDICDSEAGLQARNFYGVQVRLDIRGHCKINGIRLAAQPIDQPIIGRKVNCA